MDTDAKFAALFAGRTDVIGSDSGGCIRLKPTDSMFDQYDCHLNETAAAIGIYPVMPDNTVWWGCVDIDTGTKPGALYETWEDAWQHSLLLKRVLAALNIKSWIERTRSRGAHLWVFATEPVPAATMRRALLAAHQIAGLSQKEVNPKQEELAPGKIGNYVRLPYPYRGINQYVIEPDIHIPEALSLDEFVGRAYDNRATPETLDNAADLYADIPVVASRPSSCFDTTAIRKRSAYVAALVQNGPLNKDRSAFLWLVARTLSEAEVPFAEAWEVICEADRRWGKFHDKGQVEHLYRLLEKAYT